LAWSLVRRLSATRTREPQRERRRTSRSVHGAVVSLPSGPAGALWRALPMHRGPCVPRPHQATRRCPTGRATRRTTGCTAPFPGRGLPCGTAPAPCTMLTSGRRAWRRCQRRCRWGPCRMRYGSVYNPHEIYSSTPRVAAQRVQGYGLELTLTLRVNPNPAQGGAAGPGTISPTQG